MPHAHAVLHHWLGPHEPRLERHVRFLDTEPHRHVFSSGVDWATLGHLGQTLLLAGVVGGVSFLLGDVVAQTMEQRLEVIPAEEHRNTPKGINMDRVRPVPPACAPSCAHNKGGGLFEFPTPTLNPLPRIPNCPPPPFIPLGTPPTALPPAASQTSPPNSPPPPPPPPDPQKFSHPVGV